MRLSKLECINLSRVAETGHAIATVTDFVAWMNGPVKAYFSHEMMACALVKMCTNEARIKPLVSINYPPGCLKRLFNITCSPEHRVIEKWLSEYRAQIFNSTDCAQPSVKERGCSCACLSNIVAFGCIDKEGQGGTYFSFSKSPNTPTNKDAYMLEVLMPHLHTSLTRVFHSDRNQFNLRDDSPGTLTKREQQILSLMARGMSNRTIAQHLSRSEMTVQNHVKAILKKMGVRNRTSAVALIDTVI